MRIQNQSEHNNATRSDDVLIDASPHAALRGADDGSLELRGYVDIVRRRMWHMLLPAAVLFGIVFLVAFSIPSVYRSTATILIEEPEIPQDAVQPPAASYADQRIQMISQQVMTRANLWRIAEKFDLYSGSRTKEPTEALLEAMRKNIKVEMVSADSSDNRAGNRPGAPVAFTVSFDADTPEQAQHVANELASLYLNENIRRRQQRTAEASSFFADEAKKYSDRISHLERTLAEFKEKNVSRLPEWQGLNIQLRDRTENEILEADRQVRSLEERKTYLEGQLAQIKPNTPLFNSRGERVLDSEDRLKQLQTQLASASAVYSATHPDVVKMRREIQALSTQTGETNEILQQAAELTRVRSELAAARQKYSEDHPDVVKLKRALTSLQQAMLTPEKSQPEVEVQARHPENPAYITLQSQLAGAKTELRTMRTKQAQLHARASDITTRLAQTPQVEREYLDLSRERENEVKRYQEIKARQMQAQAAVEMEKDRKGERFSLLESAQMPERPQRPNRKAMLLLGLIFSLGGGVAIGMLFETLDHSVRGPRGLARAVNAPLLAIVPFIETDIDVNRLRRGRLIAAGAVFAAIAVALLLANATVLPFDAIGSGLLRRFGM